MSERFEALKEEVYKQTWKGDYWGKDGALAKAKAAFQERIGKGEQFSGLLPIASSYYAASGNAYAQYQGLSWIFPIKKIRWGFRAWECRNKARMHCDQFKAGCGLNGMTADELSIVTRINFACKEYEAAIHAAQEGLGRPNISYGTRTLLLVALAEAQMGMNDPGRAWNSYDKALKLVGQVEPTTSVRVYRSLAYFQFDRGDVVGAWESAQKALETAKAHELHDQQLKLQLLLRKLKMGKD